MKGRAGGEDIVDQKNVFGRDAGSMVYGESTAKICETFFFREGRLWHGRPDSEKTGQEQWDLEMLTQAMCQ